MLKKISIDEFKQLEQQMESSNDIQLVRTCEKFDLKKNLNKILVVINSFEISDYKQTKGLLRKLLKFRLSSTSRFIVSQSRESFSFAEKSISLCIKCSASSRITPMPKALFILRNSSISSGSSDICSAAKYPSCAQLELDTAWK